MQASNLCLIDDSIWDAAAPATAGGAGATYSADLEDIERICRRVETFWGYPEFRSYIEDLVVVERERTSRSGFPPGVLQELMFLHELDRDQGMVLNRDTSSQGIYAMERRTADVWQLNLCK